MGFGDTVLANAVSGVAVAIVVAIIGVIIARWYTERREAAQTRREHDLAAAAELYRVYGEFFAAWKVWNAHLRRTASSSVGGGVPRLGVPDEHRTSELLGAAAAAEGGFEALIVRLTFEHALSRDQRAALWCLRSAYKLLRRAILDGKPLPWWRTDRPGDAAGHDGYRAYQAFKMLTSLVADVLLTGPGTPAPPAIESRLEALRQVTGPGREFVEDKRISQEITAERARRQKYTVPAQKHWEWVVVAEQVLARRASEPSLQPPPAWQRLVRRFQAPPL